MRQVTTGAIASPATALDPEVVEFRSQFDKTSPLDALVRTGAQRMLQSAIEAEVEEFIAVHGDRRDADGNRLVVRNGYQPARELLTGAGRLEVQQPRVRDNSAEKEGRVRFSSSILPPYLRRSKSIDELIPWLYLERHLDGRFLGSPAIAFGRRCPQSQPERGRAPQGEVGSRVRPVEPSRPLAKNSTCTFGRTEFTSTCVWKMRRISGSACSC